MISPSGFTELWFKQLFENATADGNSHCRSVVNSASCELQLPPNVSVFQLAQGRMALIATRGSQDRVYDKLKKKN